jgi:hypothetical protein
MTTQDFTCQCAGAGYCPVYKRYMGAREQQICSGQVLTPERQARYRAMWSGEPYLPFGRPSISAQGPGRPGAELKALLESLGIQAIGSCACDARAAMMDAYGPEWCRQNSETVVSWLRDEASARSLPFVDFAARQLVKIAIRRAERENARARRA